MMFDDFISMTKIKLLNKSVRDSKKLNDVAWRNTTNSSFFSPVLLFVIILLL